VTLALGGLPRRDLWLLPLVSFATMVVLALGAEFAARTIWPEQLVNACRLSDPAVGVRYQPNCSTTMKTPEGPWYIASYNNCGYRSATPCGPLAAGSRRIALLGSSTSEGYLVEYTDTIAARLAADLTRTCGAPVDVQNLGALASFGPQLLIRMDEALRLKPTAVVLVVAPFDLEELASDPAPNSERAGNPLSSSSMSFQKKMFEDIKDSRALKMAQHFLFRNPSVYLPLYLRYGDKADFLRPPLTAKWQNRLQALDGIIAGMSDRARSNGVDFVVAFVPQEAQVAMMAAGRTPPPRIDPTALPTAIAEIAKRRGAQFVDSSIALRQHPAPERLYYQVDGHLTGEGQPIVGAYIAHELAGTKSGPFGVCRGTIAASAEAAQ
jgi:hypothetical protein